MGISSDAYNNLWYANELVIHAYAAWHPEGGCDSGEYSDDDVQNFTPDVFVFHDILSYDWRMMM